MVDRCRCGDDFCASFYTVPPALASFGPGDQTIALSPREGMLNIDVVGAKIVQIEVLYREGLRKKVHAAIP